MNKNLNRDSMLINTTYFDTINYQEFIPINDLFENYRGEYIKVQNSVQFNILNFFVRKKNLFINIDTRFINNITLLELTITIKSTILVHDLVISEHLLFGRNGEYLYYYFPINKNKEKHENRIFSKDRKFFIENCLEMYFLYTKIISIDGISKYVKLIFKMDTHQFFKYTKN